MGDLSERIPSKVHSASVWVICGIINSDEELIPFRETMRILSMTNLCMFCGLTIQWIVYTRPVCCLSGWFTRKNKMGNIRRKKNGPKWQQSARKELKWIEQQATMIWRWPNGIKYKHCLHGCLFKIEKKETNFVHNNFLFRFRFVRVRMFSMRIWFQVIHQPACVSLHRRSSRIACAIA